MMLRGLVAWLALLVVAVVNGILREGFLSPRVGADAGQAISTVLLCAGILGVTWLTIGWVGPATPRDAWILGLVWLALTLAFEFLAGHYLFGHSWERLRADYDILRGRIWILVLVTTLVAPWATGGWRGLWSSDPLLNATSGP